MALDAGTAKTDWTSGDPIARATLNRIEGNIQSLEDSKVENVSGSVSFRGSSDGDFDIDFASDASIQWDNSRKALVSTKPISAPVDLGDLELVSEHVVTATSSGQTFNITESGLILAETNGLFTMIGFLDDLASVSSTDSKQYGNAFVSFGDNLKLRVVVNPGSYPGGTVSCRYFVFA